jgi:predicted nucleotidyltransferase
MGAWKEPLEMDHPVLDEQKTQERRSDLPAAAMILDRDRIFEALGAHRAQLQVLGLRRIGLFGSCARGEAREDSDLDFLVEFAPGTKTFDNYMGTKELLEDLFGAPVDLVIPETLKARLREGIFRETVYAPGF